jgi:hypothetical protein
MARWLEKAEFPLKINSEWKKKKETVKRDELAVRCNNQSFNDAEPLDIISHRSEHLGRSVEKGGDVCIRQACSRKLAMKVPLLAKMFLRLPLPFRSNFFLCFLTIDSGR